MEAAAAQVIDQLVAGDRPDPRFERLAFVPRVALEMHREQGLLNHVLDIAGTAPGRRQPAAHDAAQPRCQPQEQSPIGLVVTAPGLPWIHLGGDYLRAALALALTLGIVALCLLVVGH